MIFYSFDKPDSCPSCGSSRIATIVYGEPDGSPEFMEKLRSGEIVTGGCVISVGGDNPSWQCLDCECLIIRGEPGRA